MKVEEARALVEEADVKFKTLTERIDVKIREFASQGKEELNVGYEFYDLGISEALESYRTTDNLDPHKKKLVEKLIVHYVSNGFSAVYGAVGESYVPRAYEDHDSPSKFYTWTLTIGWKS